MEEKPLQLIEEKKLSRRAVVKGTLIGLGAAMLVQAKGGVAQDEPKKDEEGGKKKKGKKKKSEDEPKKD